MIKSNNGFEVAYCDKCKNQLTFDNAIHLRNAIFADFCEPCVIKIGVKQIVAEFYEDYNKKEI